MDEVLVHATGLEARFEAECAAAIPGWRPDVPPAQSPECVPARNETEMSESAD
jgi:hypothetical protein